MGDKKEILESRDRVICNLVVETPKTRWTIGGGAAGAEGATHRRRTYKLRRTGESRERSRWTGYPVIWAGATRLSRRPKNHDFVAAEVYIIREN